MVYVQKNRPLLQSIPVYSITVKGEKIIFYRGKWNIILCLKCGAGSYLKCDQLCSSITAKISY
jgi:hypothetical protein